MDIETGDPVVVVNAKGMQQYGLADGDIGWANSVIQIPEDDDYVMFMKEGQKSILVLSATRLEVNQELKDAGIELDKDTIAGT